MPSAFQISALPRTHLLEDNLHPDFDYDQQKSLQTNQHPILADTAYDCSDFEDHSDCLDGSHFLPTLDHLRLVTNASTFPVLQTQMSQDSRQSLMPHTPYHHPYPISALAPQWSHDLHSTDQESCSNASAWSPQMAESQTDYEVMSNGCASWTGPPEAGSPEVSFSKPITNQPVYSYGQWTTDNSIAPDNVHDRASYPDQRYSVNPSYLSASQMGTPAALDENDSVRPNQVLPSQPHQQPFLSTATSEPSMMLEDSENAIDDRDADCKPAKGQVKSRRRSAPALGAKKSKSKSRVHRVQNSRVSKQPPKRGARTFSAANISRGKLPCRDCESSFASPTALHRHTLKSHRRPFTCAFRRYGCASTFGSKNEWKRHVSSQHLCLSIYRCDLGGCVPQARHHSRKSSSASTSQEDLIYNEFNRKDLFTQHVRRMHGPGKTALADVKDAFENSLEDIRQRCWIYLRDAPSCSTCGFCPPDPNTKQDVVFSGPTSWDERMEHVGRHLEKCEKDSWEREDKVLRDWLIQEGLLEETDDGWKIVGCANGKKVEFEEEDADGEDE